MTDKTPLARAAERDWPHLANYFNRCMVCGHAFAGPKRAPTCWGCSSEQTKAWWVEQCYAAFQKGGVEKERGE